MKSNQPNYAYVYPPDIQKCHKHRNSMRIFKGLDHDDHPQICQCCQRRVGVEQQTGECCYDKMELSFLGSGLPLFFTFIRNAVILLFILSIIFCGFALYSNIVTGDCNPSDKCSNNAFDTLAIINKISSDAYLSIQNYVLLGFVVVSLFVFQCFRYNFRSVEDECDDIVDSPSDYAMILRRLPADTTTADIEEMIEERRGFLSQYEREKTENLRVISIVMSFKMGEYTQVKQKNQQSFQKHIQQEEQTQEFVPQPLPLLTIPSSIAVVVFARQQSKDMFYYRPNIFQKLLQCIWTPCIPRSDYTVKGEKVAIERAPEPDDIVWANSGISMCGAITRKTLYGLLSIFVLLCGGAAQYGLAVAEQRYAKTDTEVLLMSTASSILVSILNAIIQIILIFTSIKERNQTLTEYNSVLATKLSLFQFLNAGVFVLLANFLANTSGFTLDQGLAFEITQVMMLNAVTPNLTQFLFNYFEIVNRIKRCCIEGGSMKKSQLQANKIYERPIAQIAYKYGYIFKTMWLTAFYAPLVPIVVPVSIFGLIVNYFVEKCLYGKSYSTPNMLSSMLNDTAIELMEFFPFILAVGEWLLYLYFRSFHFDKIPEYWSIPIYISLGLSLLNLLLPMDDLNHKLCKLPFDTMVYPDYEKVQQKFEVTYEMTNPAYECKRKRGRDKFIMKKIFGEIQMTNMGMFGNNAMFGNTGMNQPLIQDQNQGGNPNFAALALANKGMEQGDETNRQLVNEQQSMMNEQMVSEGERYSSVKSMKKELMLSEAR